MSRVRKHDTIEYVILGTAMNMLDVWLPVVLGSDNRNQGEVRIVVVVPYHWVLERVQPDDILVEMADAAKVQCILVSGNAGIRFASISEARMSLFGSKSSSGSVQSAPLANFVTQLRKMLRRLMRRLMKRYWAWTRDEQISAKDWQTGRVLLYDWSLAGMGGICGGWFSENSFAAAYAANHAVIPVMATDTTSPGLGFSDSVRKRTLFAVHNHMDQDVPGVAVLKSGIARHDSQWLETLCRYSRERHSVSTKDIVLFSRGTGSGWPSLTGESGVARRADILRAVFGVTRTLNLRLLVKLHPTEENNLHEILPSESAGHAWSVTVAHPLQLAQDAGSCLVIASSVVADCLRAGVIPIDVLSLEIESDMDTPLLYSRQNSLVRIARSVTDLESLIAEAIQKKRDAKESAHRLYSHIMPYSETSMIDAIRPLLGFAHPESPQPAS